jgi:MoaA/NifB/PqqE/SkfB family radical SAM enzyme
MKKQIQQALSHLYISPLKECNLNCRICYTSKTKDRLSTKQILRFVDRYQQQQQLETVTFCGGEVFLITDFIQLVNQLTQKNIFAQIITNGTIDRLAAFSDPNQINLIISLDGLPPDHDANRGQGNFSQSLLFAKKALALGFHLEIFTVVSQRNYQQLDQFEAFLKDALNFLPPITYHPRKPKAYLNQHPVSNREGQVSGFEYLSHNQIRQLARTRKIFPPRDLGCYQLSLMSNGKIYGCCEGIRPLGEINDPLDQIIASFKQRIKVPEGFKAQCLGCSEPEFVCGMSKIYQQDS